MRLPTPVRTEILEYAGSAQVEDAQLRSLLDDAVARIENAGPTAQERPGEPKGRRNAA